MKQVRGIIVIVSCLSSTLWAEAALEGLKAAADKASATLSVTETLHNKGDRQYRQSLCKINTGTKQYTMRYKTFLGDEAAFNPKELTDWSSGYGMTHPSQNWYHNGFLNVSIKSQAKYRDIRTREGKER